MAMPTPISDATPSQNDYITHPNHDLDHEQEVDPQSRQDAILDGKEKAKAVLAATGLLPHTSDSPNHSGPTSRRSTPAMIDERKLSTSSRKRSRSESRKPANMSSDLKSRSKLHDLQLDQITSRDRTHVVAESKDFIRTQIELADQQRVESRLHDVFREHRGRHGVLYPIYSSQRRRPFARKTRDLRYSRRDGVQQAESLDDLVPIRIDLEFEKLRLRDTFTWNVHDRIVPPILFAQGLIEDFRIPPEAQVSLTNQIYENMQEQIADFHPHIYQETGPLDPTLPYSAHRNDEMRIFIRLNITIGNHSLVDQFEWDINDQNNSPEEFATQMARDMSLSGEFKSAIAHSIHEQSQLFTKSLYIAAHPFDGRAIEDADVRDSLLHSPLPSAFRSFQSAKEHAPYFYELNDTDLERTELAFSREQRQQKRSTNRRGGPTLPDLKERLKTWRTMVVSSVIPGAAESAEVSGLYKLARTGGRGRRPWKADRGEDSESEESEGSEEGSPVQSQLAGTTRTRGVRSAHIAATAAMRAGYARSQTPEASLHHHETRTLPRKLGGYEQRDESENPSFIVRLKMPREKFRQWWRDWKLKQQSLPQRQQPVGTPQNLGNYLRPGYQGQANPLPRFSTPNNPMMGPPFPNSGMMQRPMAGSHYQMPGSMQRPTTVDPNSLSAQHQRFGIMPQPGQGSPNNWPH